MTLLFPFVQTFRLQHQRICNIPVAVHHILLLPRKRLILGWMPSTLKLGAYVNTDLSVYKNLLAPDTTVVNLRILEKF